MYSAEQSLYVLIDTLLCHFRYYFNYANIDCYYTVQTYLFTCLILVIQPFHVCSLERFFQPVSIFLCLSNTLAFYLLIIFICVSSISYDIHSAQNRPGYADSGSDSHWVHHGLHWVSVWCTFHSQLERSLRRCWVLPPVESLQHYTFPKEDEGVPETSEYDFSCSLLYRCFFTFRKERKVVIYFLVKFVLLVIILDGAKYTPHPIVFHCYHSNWKSVLMERRDIERSIIVGTNEQNRHIMYCTGWGICLNWVKLCINVFSKSGQFFNMFVKPK